MWQGGGGVSGGGKSPQAPLPHSWPLFRDPPRQRGACDFIVSWPLKKTEQLKIEKNIQPCGEPMGDAGSADGSGKKSLGSHWGFLGDPENAEVGLGAFFSPLE